MRAPITSGSRLPGVNRLNDDDALMLEVAADHTQPAVKAMLKKLTPECS